MGVLERLTETKAERIERDKNKNAIEISKLYVQCLQIIENTNQAAWDAVGAMDDITQLSQDHPLVKMMQNREKVFLTLSRKLGLIE